MTAWTMGTLLQCSEVTPLAPTPTCSSFGLPSHQVKNTNQATRQRRHVHVHVPRQFVGVRGLHGFTNKAVKSQIQDVLHVLFVRPTKQLSAHIQLGPAKQAKKRRRPQCRGTQAAMQGNGCMGRREAKMHALWPRTEPHEQSPAWQQLREWECHERCQCGSRGKCWP